jgi:uncharacterized membrane protein (UPF0127 family)
VKLLRHPDDWARGAIGLSLDDVEDGLLFVMDKTAPWPVTMEGVHVPLDAYWLSESGMVLEHAELFPGLPDYWPECQAKFVLELPMRESPRYHVGDFVEIPP